MSESLNKTKIIIKNFNFFYNNKHVIKDLNLEIFENTVFSIIGPASSGITTLLRSLNRLCDLNPETRIEGEILLNGKNIFGPEINVYALRRKVGMVFDVPTPLPMSIYDNVAYGPSLMHKKKREIADSVERALKIAALWDEVKERLKASAMGLSGGQQQRLCIARVLALNPEVILLDKPCSGLDPISTAKIEESLTQLKSELTVILAPHNTQQAMRVSDRLAFLLKGSLIEEGSCNRIFYHPKDRRTADYISGKFG